MDRISEAMVAAENHPHVRAATNIAERARERATIAANNAVNLNATALQLLNEALQAERDGLGFIAMSKAQRSKSAQVEANKYARIADAEARHAQNARKVISDLFFSILNKLLANVTIT